MYLIRLIYASKMVPSSPNLIQGILATSKENNEKANVTGILCFNRKYFLQCLEGARTNVNQVYRKINQDSRHDEITILGYEEISEREFGKWSMAYVPESNLTQQILLKYSGQDEFNPYQMTQKSAFLLLAELAEGLG